MTPQERKEIRELPEKYRPMSAWKIFFLRVLYSVPVLGLIFAGMHAFDGKNIHLRSFARANFVFFVVVETLMLLGIWLIMTVLSAVFTALITELSAYFSEFFRSIQAFFARFGF